MNFTPELKAYLRRQAVVEESHNIEDWIFLIIETSLNRVDEAEFPEFTVRRFADDWNGDHVLTFTQLLFHGKVVAEKVTYGDGDDIFDEDEDWVDASRQKEMMEIVFAKYVELKFS